MITNNPRIWHELSIKVLSDYRTSKRTSIWVSPYTLTYGHDAILLVDIKLNSLRVAKQNHWTMDDYQLSLAIELDKVDEERVRDLNKILAQKKLVA